MTSFGPQTLGLTFGTPIQVLANLQGAHWPHIGITVDWSTVTAVSGSDVTLPDGVVVKVGSKGLRYGQVLCKITASGKYGPYDSAATDGRQTLARDNCYILNETVLETGMISQLPAPPSDHPPVFNGGNVWYDRLLISTATNPLGPTGPTLAALDAVTRLDYVNRP